MAGLLDHSPADVLRYLLIDEGYGVLLKTGEWPIFSQYEPTKPDNCVTTYDTTGFRQGRLMPTGQTQHHYGLLVRVRSNDSPIGHKKINEITIGMEAVYQQPVSIDGTAAQYTVHSVNHASGPVYIGREEGTDRMLFTVNFLACIHQE